MKSIIPSEHQEMIHLQEGAWHQNNYANNLGQFTSSQQENHPTNNAPPESKKAKQESGRYHPHKKSFNTSASPNTEQITQDKKNHKYQNNPTKMEQNHGALKQMPNGWAISQARHQTAPVRLHKDKTTTSWRRVFEEEDIHKTGTKLSNNLRLSK